REALAALRAWPGSVGLEIRHQQGDVGGPGSRIADRVDVQLEALPEPQRSEEVEEHGDDLGIERRVWLAEGLDIELMELPVPPRLRTLVPEHRPHRVDLDRLGPDVEPVLDVGPHERGRRLWTERQRLAATVIEGVHLLRDDVGLVADAPREQLRPLEERHPDLLVAVRLEGPA